MTQAIITNLETLLSAVEAQPESLFDLSGYKQVEPCGTLFCTVGLAATMPFFQEQGVEMRPVATNANLGEVFINGQNAWRFNVAPPLFGPNAFGNLFEPADCGNLDDLLGYEDDGENAPNMTDKELAIARLRKQLEIVKGE